MTIENVNKNQSVDNFVHNIKETSCVVISECFLVSKAFTRLRSNEWILNKLKTSALKNQKIQTFCVKFLKILPWLNKMN